MMSTRSFDSPTATALLVLEPPRHCGLSTIILVPGRHLIGAQATCAIRLHAEGIADQHALVIAGEHRTVLKAIDTRTWVNEGPISDVTLRAGDRLSIGPLTFRVRTATRDERAVAATIPAPAEVAIVERPLPERRPSTARPAADAAPAISVTVSAPATTTPNSISGHGSSPGSVPAKDPSPSPSELPRPVESAAMVPSSPPMIAPAPPTRPSTTIADSHLEPIAETVSAPQRAEDRAVTTGLVDQTSPPAAEPARAISRDEDPLGWRLEEIHHRLVELRQTTDQITRPNPRPERPESDPRHPLELLQTRHAELQKRSEQVAAETQALQDRARALTEKESRLEAHQQQLRDEANRIAAVAQSARQSLAEEHAQHVATWQEWEASYQRMTRDLAENLDAIERQREILQSEATRLGAAREELDLLRAEQDEQRQTLAADRSTLTREFAELTSLRDELDRLRRQQRMEADELTQQIAHERQSLDQLRTELMAEKQELAREREALIADWSSHARRVDADNQRRSAFLAQQSEDHERLAAERAELTALAHRVARDKADLQQRELQRDAMVQRAEISLRDAESMRARVAAAEQEIAQLRAQRDHDRATAAAAHDAELQSRIELQSQLDAERRQLERARQQLTSVKQNSDAPPDAPVSATPRPELSSIGSIGSTDAPFPLLPTGVPVGQMAEVPGQSPAMNSSSPVPDVPPLPPSHDVWPYAGIAVDPTLTWSAARVNQPPVDGSSHRSSPVPPPPPPPLPLPPASAFESPSAVTPVERLAPAGTWPSYAPEPSPWGTTAELRPAHPVINPDTVDPTPDSVVGSERDPWAVAWPTTAPDSVAVAPELQSQSVDPGPDVLVADPAADIADLIGQHEHAQQEEPSLKVTLEEVNREFGTPSVTQEPAPPTLPSWWVDTPTPPASAPAAVEQPGWVLDALRAAPAPEAPSPVPASEPAAEGLRSELARLFDLPSTPPASDETATDDTAEAQADHDAEPPSAEIRQTLSEPEPAVSPQPRVEDASTPRTETSDESVDVYLAKLLARSRGENEPVSAPAASPPVRILDPVPVASEIPASDRSHLLAEPKHKQDKQAVRENLQSFREVAHLSARSALARHSLEQLRNATIAKGVLLGCSGLATFTFGIEPLWGGQFQVWKALACSLATLLSAIEFRRSWNQLYRPIQKLNSTATATPEAEPAGDAPPAQMTATETGEIPTPDVGETAAPSPATSGEAANTPTAG